MNLRRYRNGGETQRDPIAVVSCCSPRASSGRCARLPCLCCGARPFSNPEFSLSRQICLPDLCDRFFRRVDVSCLSRQWRQPSANGFSDFFTAARSAHRVLPALLCPALAIGAFSQNLHFAAHGYFRIEPSARISHAEAWHAVVDLARDCVAAHLPIPNVPMKGVTEFPTWDLRRFEPLLRAELDRQPDAEIPFAPWVQFSQGTPDEFQGVAQSLKRVRKQFRLTPEREQASKNSF